MDSESLAVEEINLCALLKATVSRVKTTVTTVILALNAESSTQCESD